MNFKSVQTWINNKLMDNNMLLVFLMILIVIVIIDCNTKIFSKMVEGNDAKPPPIKLSCGNDYSNPPKNPTDAAAKACQHKPTVNAAKTDSKVSGYDEELVLYATVDKPLGPTVPRTMQQDYTTLKSFGLTKMPDVINYIPGPGPQDFQKVSPKGAGAPGATGTKKEVHVKMYYAPWCGHSNNAKPHMEKVIEKHHNTNINGVAVKASIVDSDKQPDEVKKQKVSGFPTYKAHIIKDGKEVSNEVLQLPERTYEAIKKAIEEVVEKMESI